MVAPHLTGILPLCIMDGQISTKDSATIMSVGEIARYAARKNDVEIIGQ
jgi:hypothetical protein